MPVGRKITPIIISHTEYTQHLRVPDKSSIRPYLGEINNSKKLQDALKLSGLEVPDILDFYELLGISDMGEPNFFYCYDLIKKNLALAEVGQEILTNMTGEPLKTFQRNVEKATSNVENPVLLLMTWPAHAFLILSGGIQHRFPIIAKEYSYMKDFYPLTSFPLAELGKEISLILSESLLGCLNSLEAGVPKEKVGYLPNLSPLPKEQAAAKKNNNTYIQDLLRKNKKTQRLNDETIVIGCPGRAVRRKCVELVIYAVQELYKTFPNILLVFKGCLSAEFDEFTQYSEKLHQLLRSVQREPWFLWDSSYTPYPEILQVYNAFDICCIPSGAEIGCNTIAEVCSLGVPCVLQDASVMPYLYSDMALFAKGDEMVTKAHWAFTQPSLKDLIRKLTQLITNPKQRRQLAEKGRALSAERFGYDQISRRGPLFLETAWNTFHNVDTEKNEDKIRNQLQQDLKDYKLL